MCFMFCGATVLRNSTRDLKMLVGYWISIPRGEWPINICGDFGCSSLVFVNMLPYVYNYKQLPYNSSKEVLQYNTITGIGWSRGQVLWLRGQWVVFSCLKQGEERKFFTSFSRNLARGLADLCTILYINLYFESYRLGSIYYSSVISKLEHAQHCWENTVSKKECQPLELKNLSFKLSRIFFLEINCYRCKKCDILGPKLLFAKGAKHYPSMSRQTSLATAANVIKYEFPELSIHK